MSRTTKQTPQKLAEHPEILACAVCLRNPDGSATVKAVHGDPRYGAAFQHTLNIHMTISDQDLNVELGKLRLRSYRSGNYILMTIVLEGSAFGKSIKRTMSRILVYLNKTDEEYCVPVVPLAPGHLEQPPTISHHEPASVPVPQAYATAPDHLNGGYPPNY